MIAVDDNEEGTSVALRLLVLRLERHWKANAFFMNSLPRYGRTILRFVGAGKPQKQGRAHARTRFDTSPFHIELTAVSEGLYTFRSREELHVLRNICNVPLLKYSLNLFSLKAQSTLGR